MGKSFIKKIKDFLSNLSAKSKFFRVILETGRNFYLDDCFTFSAGISFYFLLSFIPFLILLGAVAGYIVDYIKNIQNFTHQEMVSYIMSYVKIAIPFVSEKYVLGFVNIANYKRSLTTIGLFSLVVSATLLFSMLHRCFFRIFGGKLINFILSRLMGIIFLLSITILLFFFHYLTLLFLSTANLLAQKITSLQWIVAFFSRGRFFGFLVSTIFIVLIFWLLIYYFTYGVKLSRRAVFCGALLFSVLWNSAKLFYNFYINEISNFSIIYGSATWIVATILWVYYSSLILLISMEFIKSLTKIFPLPFKKKNR